MGRVGVAVAAVVATFAGLSTDASAAEPRLITLEKIGTFTFPVTPDGAHVSSFNLEEGTKYTLVVTGSAKVASGPDSHEVDALYCFASSSNACSTPSPSGEALQVAIQTGAGRPPSTDDISEFARGGGDGAVPPYNGAHRYELEYVGGSGGRLFAETLPGKSPQPGVTYSGSFTIEVYGPEPKLWAVDFSVTQLGLARKPKAPSILQATKTTIKGRVVFAGKPRTGVTARGDLSATVEQIDYLRDDGTTERIKVYADARDPRDATRGEPLTARYTERRSPAERKLILDLALLDKSTDDTCGGGDPLQVALWDRGTSDDRMLFAPLPELCARIRRRDYEPFKKNVLRVVIGTPKRVAGSR
jgi:hypothetical protein